MLRTVFFGAFLIYGVSAPAQNTQPSSQRAAPKDPSLIESKGMPPRSGPGDYQAQGKAGPVTIGAEFVGHSVPTPEAIYATDDYVIVEVALFGPGSPKISLDNFALRINAAKKPTVSQASEFVLKSLTDPEWEPPKAPEKSKTGINAGGGGAGAPDNSPPPVVHMPFELRRPMEQRVQRASLLEGERPLPQAGLIFFEYHNKTKNIRSLELIYTGPTGNATLALKP